MFKISNEDLDQMIEQYNEINPNIKPLDSSKELIEKSYSIGREIAEDAFEKSVDSKTNKEKFLTYCENQFNMTEWRDAILYDYADFTNDGDDMPVIWNIISKELKSVYNEIWEEHCELKDLSSDTSIKFNEVIVGSN